MGKRNATNDAATHRRQARRNRIPKGERRPDAAAAHRGCTNRTSRPPAEGDLRKRCHAHSMQLSAVQYTEAHSCLRDGDRRKPWDKEDPCQRKAPRAQDTASARGAIRQRPTLRTVRRTVRRRRYAASDISERDASAPDTSEPSAPLSSAPAEGFARLPPKLVTVRSPDASAASSSSFFPPLGLA